ncbi:hypothetical protein KJ780_02400 [Candidatus Micrarchaeota archaeon]|nr:hypothetical protein [Candidatus Micrarchaeota archaeon]
MKKYKEPKGMVQGVPYSLTRKGQNTRKLEEGIKRLQDAEYIQENKKEK